jgi:hypothetical protein
VQFLHGAVLHAHFTDFRADGDRYALGLLLSDESRDLGCTLVVEPLLLTQWGFRQVHQRRSIHVDIVEAGPHLFCDQLLDLSDLAFGIGLILLVVNLAVIALNEEWQRIALTQRGRYHHRHVFSGSLLGVGNFRSSDFQDDSARLAGLGSPEDGAGGVVRQHPNVDCRYSKPTALPPPARQVQVVDRRRPGTSHLSEFPQQPAGRLALLTAAEHCLPGQPVRDRGSELGLVPHPHSTRNQQHPATI